MLYAPFIHTDQSAVLLRGGGIPDTVLTLPPVTPSVGLVHRSPFNP